MKSYGTDGGFLYARLIAALLMATSMAAGYDLDLSSIDSLKHAASFMAQDMMSFYSGDQPGGIPGLLPQPYYWWEAGALMGSLIDYWYYTGDSQWNDLIQQGLLFQAGPNSDYMPPNQTMTEGNDDQGFWGMSVMSAAEYKFQDPPSDKPQWLALAQAVFNTQAARWDTQECGGGLRWQIFTWNQGYDYKNSISQACFFNIAARLARYTGNQSYADWADKTWDWMVSSKFMDTQTYYIYDGAHTRNCSEITPYQWTYNSGAFLLGAAAMYNYTTGSTQEIWRSRVDGLITGLHVFFTGPQHNIMTEVACEPVGLCDLDQQSFKAYLTRAMAATTKWAPWTYSRIKPLLESTAIAATSTCLGGSNGRMCGLKWTEPGKWDGTTGVGQQMAAMELVLANMIQHVTAPVTNHTGGTSTGDPGAGGSDVGRTDPFGIVDPYPPITTADRVGAWIITVVMILGLVAGCVMMALDEKSNLTTWQRLSTLRPDVLYACGKHWRPGHSRKNGGGRGGGPGHGGLNGATCDCKYRPRFDIDDTCAFQSEYYYDGGYGHIADVKEKDTVIEIHHEYADNRHSWHGVPPPPSLPSQPSAGGHSSSTTCVGSKSGSSGGSGIGDDRVPPANKNIISNRLNHMNHRRSVLQKLQNQRLQQQQNQHHQHQETRAHVQQQVPHTPLHHHDLYTHRHMDHQTPYSASSSRGRRHNHPSTRPSYYWDLDNTNGIDPARHVSQISGMSALPGGAAGLVPDGATGFTPHHNRSEGAAAQRDQDLHRHHHHVGQEERVVTRNGHGNGNGNRTGNAAPIGDRINNWREADKERREVRNNRNGGNRFAWESSESVYWGS
ncbi:glycosyl hydrolase family 76-domain-containing protein [Sordaria brevicollis]|uniref:mannan endo-1,6-alpha-mannosidase n=1 Tax=Sordaria brevicollis TaxID=83679 RepID=A0AAE0NWE2_SORBR|nr:glycosyl hydrolase family 76-domain-containing protein [Sordaria brevicollis]